MGLTLMIDSRAVGSGIGYHKMAALISWKSGLYFCPTGESGNSSNTFICVVFNSMLYTQKRIGSNYLKDLHLTFSTEIPVLSR